MELALQKCHFNDLLPVHFGELIVDFPVTFDNQSTVPLHRQLYEEIRRAILSGRLPAGQRVPSTRSLSESLGISRATVTLAYDYLLDEGYLQSTLGSGTYVCRQLPDELLRPANTSKVSARKSKTTEEVKVKGLSRYGAFLKDRPWLDFSSEEPEIQFSFGRPDMKAFPLREWQQLVNHHLKERNLTLLDSPANASGYLPLRNAIAQHLAKARAVRCDAKQIIIVNGSQQAIDLVTRIFVDRGDFVGIEEPGYMGAKKAFEVQGAKLIGFPVDNQGLIVEKLRDQNLPSLKLLYVTPSHQFPTGVVLSLPRRLELIARARQTGTIIVEDDYDSEYRYTGRPVPALAGLEHGESVIYIGTFSKVLFPALRLGYLVVPHSMVELFTRAKWLCDRHSPLLDQQVLADFITSGLFERHVRKMRRLYEERRKHVISALKLTFGNQIEILGDNAGINVLVRFLRAVDDKATMDAARALGVGLARTANFYLQDAPGGEFLLNYGGLSTDEIEEGIRRLALATVFAE